MVALSILLIGTLLVGVARATKVENLRGSSVGVVDGNGPTRAYAFDQAEITQDHARKLLFHEEKVKVVVKTKTKEKREKIKKKGSKIKSESDRFGKVAMEVTPQVLQELVNDSDVSVEFDVEMHAIMPPNDWIAPSKLPKKPIKKKKKRKKFARKRPKLTNTNRVKNVAWKRGRKRVGGRRKKKQANSRNRRRRLAEEEPYGVALIQADQVPPNTGPDAGDIKVCIVDTGFDLGHPDLPSSSGIVDGKDSNENGKWDEDEHGHGTHCAGIVAAIGGNGEGVRGAVMNAESDGIKLFIGKGLDENGSSSSSDVMDAIASCIDNGANIISLSLGGSVSSDEEEYEAYYREDNVLFVAAAGNDGDGGLSYPASYASVISVAATDDQNRRASFSQYNTQGTCTFLETAAAIIASHRDSNCITYNIQVKISAPGVGVLSTLPRGHRDGPYKEWSGTSMATPYVAGVAALVWSYNSTCSPAQIRRILLATALDLGDPGCERFYGHGLVQAKAAKEMLEAGGCEAADDSYLNLDNFGLNSQGTCPPPPPYQCPPGHSLVKLDLFTDNYPGETHWSLKDSSDNMLHSQSVGHYTDRLTPYVEQMCVENGQAYSFTMMDTYGDGICCSWGEGNYTVTCGEEVVVSSARNFGSSEMTSFDAPNDDSSEEPSLSPTGSVAPSLEPSSEPSPSPSVTPSKGLGPALREPLP